MAFSVNARRMLTLLCLAGFLTFGVLLLRYEAGSRAASETNQAVEALYNGEEEAAATPTNMPAVTGELLKTTPGPSARPSKFQKTSGTILHKFRALIDANPDVVGWLTIGGVVDLPVVYRDNAYYLRRDFYRKRSSAGTLFLDEKHPLKAGAQNLIIHGHNMHDESMFGKLHRYLRLDFLQKHPLIQFDTLYQENTYVIVAVANVSENVSDPEYFNYLGHPSFRIGAQFLEYVAGLVARSVYEIPVDVNESDVLLTLSTCCDDGRLLVVARRVRPDESLADVKALVYEARQR